MRDLDMNEVTLINFMKYLNKAFSGPVGFDFV